MAEEENKQTDPRPDFIVYLDEDGEKKNAHVKIIEMNGSYVTFKTYGENDITIPIYRVLKIKRKSEEGDSGE